MHSAQHLNVMNICGRLILPGIEVLHKFVDTQMDRQTSSFKNNMSSPVFVGERHHSCQVTARNISNSVADGNTNARGAMPLLNVMFK